MRRTTLYIIVLLLSVAACTKHAGLTDAGSAGARYAAEHFYDMLGRGQAREYVDNMQEAGVMDSSKRAQFVDMMEQFLYEERQASGGILSAKATRDTIVDSVALVFMDVQYADSTCEEIMLPLVYTGGRWWVR